jgi:hypothetical protein
MDRKSSAILEQTGNYSVAEAVELHLHKLGIEGARQHDPNTGEAGLGSYASFTPQQLRNFNKSGGALAGPAAAIEEVLQTVREAGGEQLIERLKELDANMAAVECPQPEIGRLIDSFYVPFLLSALELSDEEFDAEYPGEKRVTAAQRKVLAEIIERHSLECPRCLLKASSDWEWDAYIYGMAEKNSVENDSRVRIEMRTASVYTHANGIVEKGTEKHNSKVQALDQAFECASEKHLNEIVEKETEVCDFRGRAYEHTASG